MIKEIKRWMRNKDNARKMNILAISLVILTLFGENIGISSQSLGGSIFGLLSTSFIIGIALIIVGVVGFVIPEGVSTIAGIGLIALGAIVLTGGTLGSLAILAKSLPSPGGFPLWAVLMLGIIILIIFRKKIMYG